MKKVLCLSSSSSLYLPLHSSLYLPLCSLGLVSYAKISITKNLEGLET